MVKPDSLTPIKCEPPSPSSGGEGNSAGGDLETEYISVPTSPSAVVGMSSFDYDNSPENSGSEWTSRSPSEDHLKIESPPLGSAAPSAINYLTPSPSHHHNSHHQAHHHSHHSPYSSVDKKSLEMCVVCGDKLLEDIMVQSLVKDVKDFLKEACENNSHMFVELIKIVK